MIILLLLNFLNKIIRSVNLLSKMLHYNLNPLKLNTVKFVILFSLLIVIVNLVIIGMRANSTYENQVEASVKNIERLTKTVADHIELTFLAVDVVLKRGVEKHQSNLLFGGSLSMDTQNNVISWVNETPQIAAMLITDEFGKITAIHRKEGYKPWMGGKEAVPYEKYFLEHMDEIDNLYVGKQNSYMKDKGNFFVLSRRMNKLDGSFDGVLVAVVECTYIKKFFRSIEQGKKTSLLVHHLNNNEKIIFPFGEEGRSEIDGWNAAQKEFNAPARDKKNVFVHSGDEDWGDDYRMYSFFNIPSVLMRVSLVVYGEDVFKTWYKDRVSDLFFFVIFLLFVFGIGFFTLEMAKKVQKLRVSERKALAASKTKSDFLANMSHELRTPLNAIIGFSEMLNSEYFGKVNDKQKERLNDIHSCGNHLLALINEVLDFSKGQAGKLEIKSEELDFSRVVRESIRLFEERANKDNVKIVYKPAKNLPNIFADKRKLKQILINLISNSVKFCEKGGVIKIVSQVNEKGNFEFYVKDNGIGMKQDDIPRALTAFGQVHRDSAIGGTGLGLPLCKIFAELHQGELNIESKVNSGTCVTVELPKKIIC